MNKETVKAYCIGRGQPDEHYELRYAIDGAVIPSSPDNWKTFKGAAKWALTHGLAFVEDSERKESVSMKYKYKTKKTKQEILEIIVREFQDAHIKALGTPYATSKASLRELTILELMKKIEIYDAE